MEAINIIKVVLEEGFKYAILALGVYLSYSILDFPDLSVDGTMPLGAILSSVLILHGVNPWISLLIAFAGGLAAGFTLAIFMSNAGGAWDNAKKYVEEGNYGGKGSNCHKATIVGDTVGDPFKDTSGPSINILIKLMTVVALVFAPLFIKIGGLL